MKIVKSKATLSALIASEKSQNHTIGYVPTMGALHNGHISLISEAAKHNDVIVCSIFVNPTQFNDKKDLEKYPVTIEADVALLTNTKCNILYLPSVSEVYENGMNALETYDFGYLETVLDGAARPGHFQGVAQVLSRLFDAVCPDNLYMGQKDYQQCMIVKKLMAIRNDNFHIHFVPTHRDSDGLAMSSRNRRLTESQRAVAGLLYQCLVSIEAQNGVKPFSVVQKECTDLLIHKGIVPDYIVLADADTLQILEDYTSAKMVALIAAFVGEVRLIDNIILQTN